MKKINLITWMHVAAAVFLLSGCCRSSDEVWDDTKTASRHMRRGFGSLAGKHGDSRQVRCREDFLQCGDNFCQEYAELDFDPLPDQHFEKGDLRFQPPRIEPGQTGKIPGIDGFQDPKQISELRETFRNVHFAYNSSLVKGQENRDILRSVGEYMNRNPSVYLFVEGHCDERGAEAFNLALGARRSNAVRNILIQEGAAPEKIFTVSYGKERPLTYGHSEADWAKNRRTEFKIFDSAKK